MRLIEQYAAAAWPAVESREEEGWLLRYTPDVPRRRSNSALPLTQGRALLAALSRVEDFYRDRGMPIAVQVAPAEEHADLDALLAERGYRRDAATRVCVAPTGTVIIQSHPSASFAVTLTERPTRHWLDAYVALDGHENSRETADQVLSRVPGPAAYLSVEHGVGAVGVGLIVAAPGCGGVFCMATHPGYRRQGIATSILHVGARWAAARGAGDMYLQVMDDHEHYAARQMYDRVGFRVSHTYHYRLKP
ncbi:GNAT family N-acetyltransferase [Actinomadura montaniterrae]|uniref:GNAT family N-acetyltransferase n=1 Tax=Actinomadura montaniterrae TaxID=1803903 RepID=A0A6L3W1T3_9ACTN|nr:GNAT family N-acetyltransferase [Actinomadura montaniterrae]KAB2383683.1 GNAT family N-acetyltransferase [Actinomadura montaniterrae]